MAENNKTYLKVPIHEDDHYFGDFNAPTIIVQYGNYQCFYCKHANTVIEDLQNQLGEQVTFVFRHLPLENIHPFSKISAYAAEAAALQGEFWEMHYQLFAHFDEHNEIDTTQLVQYAREIGLDVDKFKTDLEGKEVRQRVEKDRMEAMVNDVAATPTFFINNERYDGAWDVEAAVDHVRLQQGIIGRPLGQFFRRLSAYGSIFLLLATVIALIWANFFEGYEDFWHIKAGIFGWGQTLLEQDLGHWVNDGLMVIFFFVVGLEVKREVLKGELSTFRSALLPVVGAVGGMVVPALVYVGTLVFLGDTSGMSGWGIPMATDIAFTLAILIAFGKRIPLPLKVFFTALAIADDLGAVMVITIFYSDEINFVWLIGAVVVLAALFFLNRRREYSPIPYLILGVVLWVTFLQSGIHSTIAGVLLAMFIPTLNPPDQFVLFDQVEAIVREYRLLNKIRDVSPIRGQRMLHRLDKITDRMQSPADDLEHTFQPFSALIILPIFALANAGVKIGAETNLFDPISIGIILGLVVGKPLGISAFAWLAVKMGWTELPRGVEWGQFVGTSVLAGIGFTISLFIANAGFSDPATIATAKLSILVASVLAAVIGSAILMLTSKNRISQA